MTWLSSAILKFRKLAVLLSHRFQMSPFSLSTITRFEKAPSSDGVFKAIRFQIVPFSY